MTIPVKEYERRFPPLLPPDHVVAAGHHLQAKCPITHSEIDDGFWVVNTYDESLQVLQDPVRFAVGTPDGLSPVKIPRDRAGIVRSRRPPIDVNPPQHRQFRNLINPWLSPQALAHHELGFRRIIGGLIDKFAPDGRCDIAGQLAKVFPAQLTFTELFGIEDGDDLAHVRELVRILTYDLYRKEPAELGGYQAELERWIMELVAERRGKGRIENLLDAVIHGEVDGRPMSDEELIGTIVILILGGFSTTADATCNLVIQMIELPVLQDRLRTDPTRIKPFIEEVLRLEPPITARARRATEDLKLREVAIGSQDRVLVNIAAANRDPLEFERPDDFDMDRPRNRHLTFSAGVHRCVGSTMARMSLSIMVEELLDRLTDLRFAPGRREERVSFSAGVWRAVDSLPVVFSARG